jgi:phage terminase large subunit-like protein
MVQVRDHIGIASRYIEDVLTGKIPACKWVKKACQRQKDDRKRWKSKTAPFYFDVEKAARVCEFVELLPHIKGPLSGQNITLDPWQVFCLTTSFGWVRRSDGKRRFRRIYIEVPRGNGKSSLSSAIGLYMLCADGEGGAECYSLATTRDQARIVFGDAQAMAKRRPEMMRDLGVEVIAHNINQIKTASKFEALSAESSTLDGLNIHFGCVDELHAHKTRTVYDVVETGTGKRDQSLLWIITTAGSDRSGICYEVRTFVTKILDGIFADDTQFGIIYGLDDGDDWTSEAALIKANPNWRVSVRSEVLLPLQAKAMQMPSAVNNFKTKHLNEWVNADTAWMDMRSWDACADPTISEDDFLGEECIASLDLASKVDIAAKAKLFQRDGKFYAFLSYYLPESAADDGRNSQYSGWARQGLLTLTPGNVTDFDQIEAELIADSSRFQLREVPFDPFQATQLSSHLLAEGLPMVEMRPTVLNFSEPMKELEALVLQKKFVHDGDPILAWMVSNVVCHRDQKDNIYPRKEREENKIDGVVALIMALGRAMVGPTSEHPVIGSDYQLLVG